MPESTETYEFASKDVPAIVVQNRAGAISIAPGPADHVAVRVTRRAEGRLLSRATAADLANIVVNVTQQGNTIRIEGAQHDLAGAFKNFRVDIAITTPATSNLDLHLNAGDINLRDLTGQLACVLNAGNLGATGLTLTGPSSCLINAGNLTLEGAFTPGAALTATIHAGSISLRLPQDSPVRLHAHTDVGSIDLAGWPIPISRRVVQQDATGPLGANTQGDLRLRVSTGSIDLRAIKHPLA